ncbi:hypothetical protein ACWX0K_07180 [Nitrobacteraceae bacterium UC4446_H13]
MALQTIGIGGAANDGSGDPLRVAGSKIKDNFAELYSGGFTAEISVASAATCDIGAAASPLIEITGTTAITSFGTVANRLRLIRFSGALTLTHGAALLLPGAANITTAAGDTAIAASDASGKWRVYAYQAVATGWSAWTPTITSSGGTVTGATITVTADYKYSKLEKEVSWSINCALTNVGSGSPTGAVIFSLPSGLAPAKANNASNAYYVNTGLLAGANASSDGKVYALKADGSTFWANGNVFALSGSYKVA